jgi:hypothetical protein
MPKQCFAPRFRTKWLNAGCVDQGMTDPTIFSLTIAERGMNTDDTVTTHLDGTGVAFQGTPDERRAEAFHILGNRLLRESRYLLRKVKAAKATA